MKSLSLIDNFKRNLQCILWDSFLVGNYLVMPTKYCLHREKFLQVEVLWMSLCSLGNLFQSLKKPAFQSLLEQLTGYAIVQTFVAFLTLPLFVFVKFELNYLMHCFVLCQCNNILCCVLNKYLCNTRSNAPFFES